MVLVGRFALIVATFADGFEEDNTMLQHQGTLTSRQEVNQSLNPASITNRFRWKHCHEVRQGNYASHVAKCQPHQGKELYVQIGKRKGGTTCENEGLFPITTATQCKTALDALGLVADNVEAAEDDWDGPKPIEAYRGMKMHNYPNGRPFGCSYHASWPLVVRAYGAVKQHMSAAYVHTVSNDDCGSGNGWQCICTNNPTIPVAEIITGTPCQGAGGCDPLEVATDEFCAFFCGNADPGHVTGQCNDLNPNFWGYLKKGNNKARNELCSTTCAPQPVNGVCVRQTTTTTAVLYQDLCYSNAKAWKSGGSNDQMARMMSDFCTFVCDKDTAGPTGKECKHKDNNDDVSDVCAQYCSFKENYNIAGVMQGACSKNQNTKDLCTPLA